MGAEAGGDAGTEMTDPGDTSAVSGAGGLAIPRGATDGPRLLGAEAGGDAGTEMTDRGDTSAVSGAGGLAIPRGATDGPRLLGAEAGGDAGTEMTDPGDTSAVSGAGGLAIPRGATDGPRLLGAEAGGDAGTEMTDPGDTSAVSGAGGRYPTGATDGPGPSGHAAIDRRARGLRCLGLVFPRGADRLGVLASPGRVPAPDSVPAGFRPPLCPLRGCRPPLLV